MIGKSVQDSLNEAPPACRIETGLLVGVKIRFDRSLNEAPPACRIETYRRLRLAQHCKSLNEAPPACRIETPIYIVTYVRPNEGSQ